MIDHVGSPLRGKCIAITRPLNRSRALCEAMTGQGAAVLAVPAIEIVAPLSWDGLDHSLERLVEYDWLLIASTAAVEVIAHRLSASSSLLRGLPAQLRVAAVGSSTAAMARDALGRVDHVGDRDAVSLASTLPALPGERALFVCSDRTPDILDAALSLRGVGVDRSVGYRIVAADVTELTTRVQSGDVDAIVFASPSAVVVVARALNGLLRNSPPAIAIGETTARAARAAGFDVRSVARQPNHTAIVEAAIGSFASFT